MSFTTWSPMGVPIPGDIIVINHNVTLDTSFAYTSGSITVNTGASLIQNSPVRDIWVNGANASFTNNGTTTIRYLLLSAGSFTNSGDFNVKSFANYITANNNTSGNIIGVDSLYNDGTLNNNGTIHVMTFYNNNSMNNYGTIQGLTTVVDSMYNNGTFLNDTGALLKADSCTNANSFTNNGVINFNQFTNTGTFTNTNIMNFVDMTNAKTGIYTNKSSLIGTGSMTNVGNFDNQVNAYLNLGISFLNVDSVNNTATFTANGRFVIGDSYYNFNIVNGNATGSIQVQDTSYNSGTMSGSFDFCDMTPPATSPFVDFNLGTISPTITYCTVTGLNKNEFSNISIYPNPTTDVIFIETNAIFNVAIFNVLGEKIISTQNNKIDLSSYQNGLYFVVLKDNNGKTITTKKIVKK